MTAAEIAPGASSITVSIVVPCYNGERFLQATLESAIHQTQPPLEVIVIDDGSTDGSAAIAERFGSPVRVIRQTNHGESVARNRGVSEARGSHVLFLDADDLLWPESIERMTAALAGTPGAVALMGCAWFSTDPEHPERQEHARFDRFYPDIIELNFGPPLCWLTPIEVVRKAGGFCETLHWFEDWDLWWRVGLDEPALVPVPYIGGRYRQHAKSQLSTTSPANRARGHAALMERMSGAFLERPDLLAKYGDRVFWCAWTALKRARATGVPARETTQLATHVGRLARTGPPQLRASLTARVVRLLGIRLALTIR